MRGRGVGGNRLQQLSRWALVYNRMYVKEGGWSLGLPVKLPKEKDPSNRLQDGDVQLPSNWWFGLVVKEW